MTPFFLGQISPHPLVEGDQYDQSQLPSFNLATNSSSFSFPILFSNPQDQGVSDRDHHPQQQQLLQQEPIDPLLIGGSSDHPASFPINNNNGNSIDTSFCTDPYVKEEDPRGSGKWMSSKMRIMRKMMKSDRIVMSKPRKSIEVVHQDQRQPNQDSTSGNKINDPSCGIIRVCSDCNTTKTPLWRSGPRGPKSLCNACGIRQRKARRAMAAASLDSGLVPADKPIKARKKRSDVDRSVPFKKRYKIATTAETTQKTLRFDDITISLSKDSAFRRVFPQDERDAAILLMALSCGLIRS